MKDPESWHRDVEGRVKRALAIVGEQADSVHVFITYCDPETGSTHQYDSGTGNFYAQVGQIQGWLQQQDERERVEVVRKDAEEEDDG